MSRVLKAIFCHQKNKKTDNHTLYEIFFNLQYKRADLPISRSMPPFSATPSFLTSGIRGQDQQNGK